MTDKTVNQSEEEVNLLRSGLEEAKLVIEVLESSNKLLNFRLSKASKEIQEKDVIINNYQEKIAKLQENEKNNKNNK